MSARRRASATTATCVPRRVAMRRAQVQSASAAGGRRRRIERANEQAAHARMPGLGDRAEALGLARAVLAGYEPEVGFELMGVAEARRVIDRGEEGGRG